MGHSRGLQGGGRRQRQVCVRDRRGRVFPRAVVGIGQCIEFGTRKYPRPDNWKLVDGAFTRYQDSMMRHYLKFLAGQEKDSETNLLHLKHMVWNALAILELYLMDHNDETLFN